MSLPLTVKEAIALLQKQHPDAPAVVRVERLYYRGGVIRPEETEVESVAVSVVTRHTDGRVEIA